MVRTESVPCDINNPVRKPPRYSDLHISQTLPKTNKINKVRLGIGWEAHAGLALPGGGQERGRVTQECGAHLPAHVGAKAWAPGKAQGCPSQESV